MKLPLDEELFGDEKLPDLKLPLELLALEECELCPLDPLAKTTWKSVFMPI
ncbi:hypothetical protein [Clostridium fermenticellae]|uniref:hypothetical protein n=1 Tax=Clostridium fermenticellae TaxID=2068654 RepID=UPI0018F8B5C0|nr:hypothetical protein [Clostridium fermenticellae]